MDNTNTIETVSTDKKKSERSKFYRVIPSTEYVVNKKPLSKRDLWRQSVAERNRNK